MRVGIVSIYHESNTFASTQTTLADFERHMLAFGSEVVQKFNWKHHEVSAFIDTLVDQGIEAVPIMMASALPGGTIDQATSSFLLEKLVQELRRAGRLDGYLVAPHGAGVAEGIADLDGHWLSQLRQFAGPETPIIGTLDLHANVSKKMVDACDALVAYRTNPHIDQYARGADAAALMARTLRGEIRPAMAAQCPPIAINIERQETSSDPCLSLYRLGEEFASRPGILATNLVLGFPYADVAEMGTSISVIANRDLHLAQQLADEWSRELMRGREDLIGHLIEIDPAIDMALRSDAPVCILDMGDNVGGGAPGDSTFILRALHLRRVSGAFVCLYDPASASAASLAGPGSKLDLRMGAKTDGHHGAAVEARVMVVSCHDGHFNEPKPRHGAISSFDMGRTAIVRTETDITVMLTSQRVFPTSLVQLTSCGLDPGSFKILVAKGVHAPVAAYSEVCRSFIRANTPGLTTADLSALTYSHRRKPLFPFEGV